MVGPPPEEITMAMNTTRSMNDALLTGLTEGGYQTGAPDRVPTDFGHQQKLQHLHPEHYGGLPGGSALALSPDEREVLPTQLPITYIGVQP